MSRLNSKDSSQIDLEDKNFLTFLVYYRKFISNFSERFKQLLVDLEEEKKGREAYDQLP